MAKILFFFCGEGLGHSSRVLSLAEQVSKKHEVYFASYGYAKRFIESFGYSVFEVPSEIKLVGNSGSLNLVGSILSSFGFFNPLNFFRVKKTIDFVKPDLIICDSYVLGVFIGKLSGFKVWAVVNQTNVEKHFDNLLFFPFAFFVKLGFDFMLGFADKILIPDFEPPSTICLKNLDKKFFDKYYFVGPLVRNGFFSRVKKKSKRNVLVSIGGFAYREKIFDKVFEASKFLPDYNFNFVAGPNVKKGISKKNIFWHGCLNDPHYLMSNSSLVICAAGHSTIMEAICLGKPLLCFPDIGHFEQKSNALRVQELGLGLSLDYGIDSKELAKLIRFCSTDKSINEKSNEFSGLALSYKNNAHFLKLLDAEFC